MAGAEHLYVPQKQVAHVVNDRFLGLYSVGELPDYYQPTEEAIRFSEALIDRVITGEGVELIIGEPVSEVKLGVWQEKTNMGLELVLGPASLSEELGDESGSASFLWDQGSFYDALKKVYVSSLG